jgi:glycosyltransferase involved in cell wall biosynthesis
LFGLPLPFYSQLRIGLASPMRLIRLLRPARPDLIHIATEGCLGLATLVAARWLNRPVATSFHTNFDQYLGHYGLAFFQHLARSYLRWFHNRTAITLVPSRSTRYKLEESGFERVGIWSRGVDGQFFHPRHRDEAFRRELGLWPTDLLLLYVGRLAPEKNLTALLDAYRTLQMHLEPALRERVWLALIGDGPLADKIRGSRLPRLLLPGFQTGLPLARWYASADVFAFPSRSETFGNVTLEAMASGLPVVAFDCPEMRERITPGQDGLLATLSEGLAPSLELLCRKDELRRRLSTTAQQTAARWDWESVFDQLEEHYRRVIAGQRCV